MATSTQGNLAVEPDWRREVTSRLHAYRVRRHGPEIANLQSELPFEPVFHVDTSDPAQEEADGEFVPPMPAAQSVGQGKRRPERFEISIPMREMAPAATHAYRSETSRNGTEAAADVLYPVASLAERARAALLDAGLLLFSYGGMLALFIVLGGHLGLNKIDMSVTGATLVLFYAQYFALFSIFGGSTPGMISRRIRVVSFDGSVPNPRQMAWRSFGYLVSAGTCFLGFLWALWDEDSLCWHDRISQTYLTPMERVTTTHSYEV